ncbi:MAG: DEAD/DEAH box helicase [Deltaproteobacteria bacterium]|nr:DEAD/DEAH box helicase [Deltaproteobacteria bacterium]
MEINAFIDEIKKRADLRDIVHHEVLKAQRAVYAEPRLPLRPEVKAALEASGIGALYGHQASGIDIIRDGKNLVIMTPTASGKSLIYNIPVIESVLDDPEARALYIFPLKGLEQDQMRAFNSIAQRALPAYAATEKGGEKTNRKKTAVPGPSEIYDGDTSSYKRGLIRLNPPPVILTNPDMLHMAVCAFHQKWEGFLRNLKYVVIDEVHAYRGVFGSHMAHVLKRFGRILRRYGANPVFIACSATIANPRELSEMLTGRPFELINESAAPQGKRNFIFLRPPPEVSPYAVAAKLFTESVRKGFKTIAFTKARKVTEIMLLRVNEAAPDIKDRISSYRAGFLPEERRDIERRLFNGSLRGVISTSALELGVDIGGLDVCILAGYPGTISSTWQRSGRAGRTEKDSLIIMVALADALDQYFMRSPEDFFKRSAEAAVLDSGNAPITKAHLVCAASEIFLNRNDASYDTAGLAPVIEELEKEGRLKRAKAGDVWYPGKRWWKFPHREVSIRETGTVYSIVDNDGRLLGESSSGRVMHELYPGAVYLHRGGLWRVAALDMGSKKVFCGRADDVNYYTNAITNEETEIISVEKSLALKNVTINLGMIKVTETVTGYWKKEMTSGRRLGEFVLELPPSVFTTKGIWMKVDEALLSSIAGKGFGEAGSLHALEHAMIATLPLFALCDRMDLGGVSYPLNPELESAAVFVYDGHEGGVGLVKRGFDCAKEWLAATKKLMNECPCEVSCPSCTHDPKCGNANDPLDKRGAVMILDEWLKEF